MSKDRATIDRALALMFLVLAVIWAAVIFGFSSQNSYESASLSGEVADVIIENFDVRTEHSALEHYVRKTAHVCEYAVFASLVFASAAFLLKSLGKSAYKAFFVSTLAALAYSASDEFHQSFVSGRSGEVKDVLIDTCGGIAAGLLICLVMKLVSSKRSGKQQQK
ncbi:MAG: VanZ family protein [Ruminococcus sp.]|nr:VanZ family protein [Ruminococcus sp.]